MNETRIQAAKAFTQEKLVLARKAEKFGFEAYALLRDEFHVQDGDILVASMMQPLLKETDTTKEEIEAIASKRVLSLILELSPLNGEEPSRLSGYAKLIQLANILANLRTAVRLAKAGRAEESPVFTQQKDYFTHTRLFLDSCKEQHPLETSTVYVAMYDAEKERKRSVEEAEVAATE